MTTDISDKSPKQLRELIRHNELVRPTAGLAPGYAQANLVVLPKGLAFDFLLFCQRNPKPCPVLEVLEAGEFVPVGIAPEADIRSDIARYRIFRHGQFTAEESDITGYWNNELVSFLLGCSFTFESALQRAGVPLRHIVQEKNIAMYKTNIPTVPAGVFSGPLVVTMRPIRQDQVVKAIRVTSRYPAVHGAPVHIGNPDRIGIRDLSHPDYGDAVEIKNDEVPVFWACGVTPQAVAIQSRPSLMITHAPGYMFITDIRDEELAAL
jgi:uncharacterized protein YcsI (UPF0317 family)